MMVSNVTTFVIENTCASVAEVAAVFDSDLASFDLVCSLARDYFFAKMYFWRQFQGQELRFSIEIRSWNLQNNKRVIKISRAKRDQNQQQITQLETKGNSGSQIESIPRIIPKTAQKFWVAAKKGEMKICRRIVYLLPFLERSESF